MRKIEYTAEEKALIYLASSGIPHVKCASYLRSLKVPSRLFERGLDLDGVVKSGAECLSDAEKRVLELEKRGYFAVTLVSDDYPEALTRVPDAPLVLFCAGNRELLKKHKFTVVGSRFTPEWARKFGKKLTETLSRHFVIVTGLAEGGDSAAIEGALPSGNLISVLPDGLNHCYPAANIHLKRRIEKCGLLVSEYPPEEKGGRHSFRARNRLLAGLSVGTLVLSGSMRSGALITANLALEMGKDLFALPHNAGVEQGEGCNYLIREGAYLVTDASYILARYGITEQQFQMPALDGQEAEVFAVLRQEGELHAEKIAERTGLQIFEVSAILSALEIKGLVAKSGGNKYSVI